MPSLPDERAPSLDELKTFIKPGDAHLLADLDGELAGSGLMNRSDLGGAHVAPRVLPDKRGRGVGTALLTSSPSWRSSAGSSARARTSPEPTSVRSRSRAASASRRSRRDVKQVLELDDAPPPRPRDVDGVEFVSIESRPELLREAWPLAQQGYEDMPIDGVDISMRTGWSRRRRCRAGRSSRSPAARSSATRA